MARSGEPLDSGAAFPKLGFDTVAHGHITVPHAPRWCAVLLYRAHW